MNNFKILVVEDTQSWQKILDGKIRNAVQNMGNIDCDIKIIDNFDEAYTTLEEGSWDLLVTDISLSDSEQEQKKLGQELVELAYNKNVPAITVSGSETLTNEDVRDLLLEYKAYDFFSKNKFDSKRFINSVELLLEKKLKTIQKNTSSQTEGDKLSDDDKQYLITTISRLATNSTTSSKEYFKGLVNQLNLPEKWRNSIADIWTGDTNTDTSKLMNWVEQKKSYPNESEKSGYTVLGSLIEKLLEETGDRHLLKIITTYELITDENALDSLKNNYL